MNFRPARIADFAIIPAGILNDKEKIYRRENSRIGFGPPESGFLGSLAYILMRILLFCFFPASLKAKFRIMNILDMNELRFCLNQE